MALQKHRGSKTRKGKRRTHYKAIAPKIVECPNCKAPKLPHKACKSCGYYSGRAAIQVES